MYYLEFSSAAPTLTNSVVTLTLPNPYINVPDRGAVANTAIVTVHNEYGEALSAATASLASDRTTDPHRPTLHHRPGRPPPVQLPV